MVKHNTFLVITLSVIGLSVFAGSNIAKARDSADTSIQQAIFWGDDSLKTEIFLVRKSATDYHLVINSPIVYEVYYRTEINSVEPVVKEIVPRSPADNKFHRYDFSHEFTRTTPWMALEFKCEGKPCPSLNRTLLGEMNNSVTDNGYWEPGD